MWEVALISGLVVSLILAWWAQRVLGAPADGWPTDLDKHGQFGDSFGPVTALFSALALCGAIASYWKQQTEASERAAESARQAEAFLRAVQHMSEQAAATRELAAQQARHADYVAAGNTILRADATTRALAALHALDVEAIASLRGRLEWINATPQTPRTSPFRNVPPDAVWRELCSADDGGAVLVSRFNTVLSPEVRAALEARRRVWGTLRDLGYSNL